MQSVKHEAVSPGPLVALFVVSSMVMPCSHHGSYLGWLRVSSTYADVHLCYKQGQQSKQKTITLFNAHLDDGLFSKTRLAHSCAPINIPVEHVIPTSYLVDLDTVSLALSQCASLNSEPEHL